MFALYNDPPFVADFCLFPYTVTLDIHYRDAEDTENSINKNSVHFRVSVVQCSEIHHQTFPRFSWPRRYHTPLLTWNSG